MSPSESIEELVLPRSLPTSSALSHFRCNRYSLFSNSYLTRIGKFENSSCSACGHSTHETSHSALPNYRIFALLALWWIYLFLQSLVETLGSCTVSGTPWSSAIPPSLGRGPVTTTRWDRDEVNLLVDLVKESMLFQLGLWLIQNPSS